MDEEQKLIEEKIDKQLAKLGDFFDRHILATADFEYIALKAHLLAEYYLNHILILGLGSKELRSIENISFFAKVHKMKELNLDTLAEWVIDSLFKLNRIRNNLSHSLEYKISESDIDSIGFNIGKDYICKKLSSDGTNLKHSFLWVLRRFMMELYRPIATEIILDEIKEKKLKAPKLPHVAENKQTHNPA